MRGYKKEASLIAGVVGLVVYNSTEHGIESTDISVGVAYNNVIVYDGKRNGSHMAPESLYQGLHYAGG
ncbi:MAG: hypothetical protein B6U72_05915 [Candidatus Altiarchaeales archaeon ex4484_2]|nr:MAG: hypothetical protein B6U72_05915 [Candidatus Altiarchaeales archaeon ex4484_2]